MTDTTNTRDLSDIMAPVDELPNAAHQRRSEWDDICDAARANVGQTFHIRKDLTRATISTMVGRINAGVYGPGVRASSRGGELYLRGLTEDEIAEFELAKAERAARAEAKSEDEE